jgi:O-antigen/teichoic acid export membrane protein
VTIYSNIKARRSVIDTVTFRALSQVATVLGYVVLVRGMSKQDFGVLNLLYSFVTVVTTVASLGLEQTLRRYQPEYLHQGNVRAAAWLVRVVASARFGANVVVLGVLLAAWNHLAPVFHLTAYRGAFLTFWLLILLHFQMQILQMTLASHMLHRYSVGAVVVLSMGKFFGYTTLAVSHSLTLEHAIFADTAAYAVTYAFLRIVYRRLCLRGEARGPYRPGPEERRRLVRYAVYNNFNDAGTLLLDVRMDNFFIAAFIDPISVGIYAFYNRLAEMAANLTPLRLFDNVIQPLFFSTASNTADQRIPRFFTLLLNINFVPQWPALAFALVYHAELVQVVFGGKFVEYSWLLPWIVGLGMAESVSVPVSLVAQYEERAGLLLLSKITIIYNVVAMLLLVPSIGLFGAVLARASAVGLKNGIIWWHVRRRAVWGNVVPFLLSGVALWGAVVLVCLFCRSTLNAPLVVHLALGALVCVAGLLVYVRTPAISSSDRSLLASLFHGREAHALARIGILRPLADRAAP